MSKNLLTMFNVTYLELINAIEKSELLKKVVDFGVVDEKSSWERFDEKEQTQTYTYVANYEGISYRFVEVIKIENEKHKEYLFFDVFQIK